MNIKAKLRAALLAEGYNQSTNDPCLFYRLTSKEETYIIIHVDDTFIFTNAMHYAEEFVRKMNKHYEVTIDIKADSFLGLNLEHTSNGEVKLTQPKLLRKLFAEYPLRPSARKQKEPSHPYGPNSSDKQPETAEPQEEISVTQYMRLLGILMYLTKSRPDILAACSFAATKSKAPTANDYSQLYHIVDYLRATQHLGHRIKKCTDQQLQLYCEVDASYLLHDDSKGHTGYTIAFNKIGTWYNKSSKQSLVTTSSTHAEMRAIFTLVKEIIHIFAICEELRIRVTKPAIIMEDNAAVIIMAQRESSYLKKCKHFLMIINYVREQVNLGIIDIQKILGTDNNSDIHTKKVRTKDFGTKARRILGEDPTDDDKKRRSPEPRN